MENITGVNLTNQIKEDYLRYSMSVLLGRAIPSLTDGMKPIHRRILTAMKMLNLRPDGKYMKSARVEGEVMGKYSPHGSSYGSIVTLASPWNNNIPFIDGHGNFGSSVDNAAASRYTECKLSAFAWECLLDETDTWVTQPNYDGSLQEPVELNVKVPVILLNGQEGIGVGYSTRIPQHNLRDICNALTKRETLYPDFSTGCDIVRDSGLDSYVKTGTGTLRLRARVESNKTGTGRKEKTTLSFTNLPLSTNPEKIGEQIASALEKGTIQGVTNVIDESDLTGDRISVVVKAGADLTLVQRQLYHYTDLESTYPARNLCVDGVKPIELSPSELLTRWTQWRMGRLGDRFQHELNAAESRLEIVRGYLKAISKIDAVIAIIRKSASPKEALITLVSNRTLKFTSDQARAILEMKLRALTNLDSEELQTEEGSLCGRIEELKELVSNEKTRKAYLIKEIKAIGVRHGEKRRSEIIYPPEGLTVEKGTNRVATLAKPKFIKIDMQKGLVTQVKGPRGAMVLEKSDKLITLTLDGTLKKLPASYKGPLSDGYSTVALAKKETEVKERKYLAVFTLGDQLKAMMVAGEDLCKVTSKGKRVIPEEAQLLYFGEGSYVVPWASSRKRKVELFPVSTKQGKPGGRGIKVASITEVTL
jgi:DNA gyrase subunit A